MTSRFVKGRSPDPHLTAWIVAQVRGIPPGFVRTYGDIYPGAPRMVGMVLARTDERLPWHRVVRADGVAPLGDVQLERLRREGVPIRRGRVNVTAARLPHRPGSRPGTGPPAARGTRERA